MAYFSLYWVAFYYVLCRPSIRRRSDYYLHHRFPNNSWLKRYLGCYRLFLQMGKILIDQAIVGILGPEKMELTIYGRQKLLKLVNERCGFILLMSHAGCWQVALSALHFLKVPVNLLLEQEEGNIDRHYFEQAQINFPLRIIDPGDNLGATLEMLSVLKKGEVLCMMGDRVLGSEKNYLKAKFLGEEAPFPFSAFQIASAARVPVVVFFSYKAGYDTYALKVSKIIRPRIIWDGQGKPIDLMSNSLLKSWKCLFRIIHINFLTFIICGIKSNLAGTDKRSVHSLPCIL